MWQRKHRLKFPGRQQKIRSNSGIRYRLSTSSFGVKPSQIQAGSFYTELTSDSYILGFTVFRGMFLMIIVVQILLQNILWTSYEILLIHVSFHFSDLIFEFINWFVAIKVAAKSYYKRTKSTRIELCIHHWLNHLQCYITCRVFER